MYVKMSFTKNIVLLLLSPKNGWKEIKHYNTPAKLMLSKVVYPLIALLSLSAFAGLIYNPELSISDGIQQAIIEFSKYFFAYLLVNYLMTGFFPKVVSNKTSANKVSIFLQYNLVVLIIINIINNLLPIPFTYLNILYLYIFFVAWKADDFLEIVESKDKKFLVISAALLLFIPVSIKFILELFLV